MKTIVNVNSNWGIGYRGNLLHRISEDMKYFKKMTLGKVVVMGRETFESLPGRKPLKDRINIVLSRNEKFHCEDDQVIVCRSIGALFRELEKYNLDDIFVIGGESVYTQLLPYCREVYVTKVENSNPADKYFPNLDRDGSWLLESDSGYKYFGDDKFRFLKYVNSIGTRAQKQTPQDGI